MDNLATTYQHIADILCFETPNSQLEKTISNPLFNWEAIVKEGSKHFVIPAIYCRLKTKQLLHLLPDDLIRYLEFITNENRKRNKTVVLQINEISQLLHSNQIEHTFLKGAALLILGCFNDNAERMLGDIDILIAPDQLNEAYRLLCKDDYYPTEQTLGAEFFEHKHLPRLETKTSTTRIAAVEVHRKLFVKYNYDGLNTESILKESKQQNNVSIPSIKHLLIHNILNFQVNDNGALYNSISFRSTYDTVKLQQVYSGSKEWYKENIFSNYFKYSSLFFKDIKVATNVKTNIFTYFYVFKLNHIIFYKTWNKFLKFINIIPVLFNRMWFFMSNKTYRRAIINDRRRIFAHFTSIFNKF